MVPLLASRLLLVTPPCFMRRVGGAIAAAASSSARRRARRLSSLPDGPPPSQLNVMSLVDDICGHGAGAPLSQQLTHGKQFCQAYSHLNLTNRIAVLAYLSKTWSLDEASIMIAVQHLTNSALLDDPEKSAESFGRKIQRVTTVARPKFHTLLASIGHLRDGVRFLVDLRADVLASISAAKSKEQAEHLRAFDAVLKELLGYWFSVGLLQLNRITWDASCQLLEKMAEVEAVHPVRSWSDIKRRVGPYRRCFTFTHPAIPGEPLVILHVALMDEISDNVNDIVNRDDILPTTVDGEEDEGQVKAAIFYSITNVFPGLAGIDLGNHLIKTVVGEIQDEFPHGDAFMFSTLSPIPGFRAWLMAQLDSKRPDASVFTEDLMTALRTALHVDSDADVLAKLRSVFTDKRLFGDGQVRTWERYRALLMHVCAKYLYRVKRRGFAVNPVANFHLRNGSELWRLNWRADVSARGLQNSFGIMVNYRYNLDRLDESSRDYLDHHTIRVGSAVTEMLDLDRLIAAFREEPLSDDDTTKPVSGSSKL